MLFFRAMIIAALAAVATPALAAKKDNAVPMKPDIAAVVGPEVVSTLDLDNRVAFIMVSSNLPQTDEVRAKIRPQVIRTLVDEQLQRMDAEKNGIKVGDNEVNDAIAGIEKERGMETGTIFKLMERDGIPKATFVEQIRAQLAWRKLVLKKLRPLVRVNNDEVERAKLSPVAAGAPSEIKMAALTLPVDKPSREKEVLATAMKLAKELRAGASFEEVSRQLSGRAIKESEAFWIRPQQLDPVLARALANATAGMISEPVRTGGGYAIVKVYEVRTQDAEVKQDSEVAFKEIHLKSKSGDNAALLAAAQDVAKNPGACTSSDIGSSDVLRDVEIEVSQRREMASGLAPSLQAMIAGLQPGQLSAPQESTDGVRVFMLCERKDQASGDAELDRIKNRIFQQKLELEAQKYMRNLRRDTFVDIR